MSDTDDMDDMVFTPPPRTRFRYECYPPGTLAAAEGDTLRLRTAVDEASSALIRGLPTKCLNILLAASCAPVGPSVQLDDLVRAALDYQEAVDDTRVDNDELTRRQVALLRAARAVRAGR